MTDTCKEQLARACHRIAQEITEGVEYEHCPECGCDTWDDDCCDYHRGQQQSGFDYIKDALDIEYVISESGDYLGAVILVSFGGPNIMIDTRHNQVKGTWWGDSASYGFYDDPMGVDDACKELWGARQWRAAQ